MGTAANLPAISAGYSVAQAGTLVVWGTDGLLQSPFPSAGTFAGTGFYILVSMDENEKVDLDYGENGTGIEIRRTILKHGKRWNLTVVDDLQFPAPTVGQTVTLVDIVAGPTAVNGSTYVTKVCTIIDNNYRAAQKQPGQRVLQAENLTLVDSQA